MKLFGQTLRGWCIDTAVSSSSLFFFVSIISNFKASWEEEDKKNSNKIIMDPWYVAGKWETKEGRPESPSLSWQVDAASLKVNQCLLWLTADSLTHCRHTPMMLRPCIESCDLFYTQSCASFNSLFDFFISQTPGSFAYFEITADRPAHFQKNGRPNAPDEWKKDAADKSTGDESCRCLNGR